MVKSPPANVGDIRDLSSIPGLGKYPGEGHGNPLQDSCLENEQRSLVGYSPRSCKELDATKHACMHTILVYFNINYFISMTILL